MFTYELPSVWVAMLVILAIAGVMDFYRREVPVWYFPVAGIVLALWAGIPDVPAFLCLTAVYMVLCALFAFGGADGLALGFLALCMGWASLYVAIAAFLLAALCMSILALAGKHMCYPFLPFVFVAFAVYVLLAIG